MVFFNGDGQGRAGMILGVTAEMDLKILARVRFQTPLLGA
jgi:hypothetical protein